MISHPLDHLALLADGDRPQRDLHSLLGRQRELVAWMLRYAHAASPVYRRRLPHPDTQRDPLETLHGLEILTGRDLNRISDWLCPGVDHFVNRTGGTNSEPMRYPLWRQGITAIETDHHYAAVLAEFGVDPRRPTIIRAAPSSLRTPANPQTYRYRGSTILVEVSTPPRWLPLLSHGAEAAEVHQLYYDERADPAVFCGFLADYGRRTDADVWAASGSFLNLFADWARRTGDGAGTCKLISNTFEAPVPGDLQYLTESGVAGHWCDHMRACDGGLTFLTCKFGVYHTLDYLTYLWADNHRAICTDLFGLAAPFINYWGGDLVSLGADWRRCECGRWYRDFRFAGRRPFTVSDPAGRVWTSVQLHDLFEASGLPRPYQAICRDGAVTIVTARPPTDLVCRQLESKLGGLKLDFGTTFHRGTHGKTPRLCFRPGRNG